MNEVRKSRLERFFRDETTAQTVFESIRDSFLKNKGTRDVQVLAAERLAVDLLGTAWNDLSRLSEKEQADRPVIKQVGL